MEQRQEEDIDMKRYYNLSRTQRKCSRSWMGRVCYSSVDTSHEGGTEAQSCILYNERMLVLAIRFGPRFLRQSPAQLAVQLDFFPLSNIWIADGTLKSIFWSVMFYLCCAISIANNANNANNGRDWNEDKSDTFVHSFSAHVIALFHRRMLISLFGRPFYTVFGHKCHSPRRPSWSNPPRACHRLRERPRDEFLSILGPLNDDIARDGAVSVHYHCKIAKIGWGGGKSARALRGYRIPKISRKI